MDCGIPRIVQRVNPFCVFILSGLLAILAAIPAMGQPDEGTDTLDFFSLASPYHTIYAHLRYLQPDLWDPAIAARTLNVPDANTDEARQLAVKLLDVLDGNYLFVDLDALPRDPDYRDSITQKHKYVLFASHPDIFVEKVGNQWLYSKRTVQAVPRLYDDTYPWGIVQMTQFFKNLLPGSLFGVSFGQYVVILILIGVSLLLYTLLTWIFSNVIIRLLKDFGRSPETHSFVEQVARPSSLLIIVLLLILVFPALKLPVQTAKIIDFMLQMMAAIFGILIFYRAVDLASSFFEKLAAKTESTLDDHLVPLVRKALKILVIVGGVVLFLQNNGVNITALLAGLSIGGLAFALAAQDTVKNFFGSIMIFIDKPFQIGDWVVFGDTEGTVEEVGIRSTRIRTFYNSLIYVPNAKLADSVLDNMGLRRYRRYSTKIGITYDTPPDHVEAFVEGLRKIVDHHPRTRKDYYQIFFNNMASSSLEVLFYIFFEVPDWTEELRARHEVLLGIMRLADSLGISFAFPTQSIHVETMPDASTVTPVHTLSAKELEARVDEFFRGWKHAEKKTDVDEG